MRNICQQSSHYWVWWGLAWAFPEEAALEDEILLLAVAVGKILQGILLIFVYSKSRND